MSKPMVKTPEGRKKLEAWHHTFRARIPAPTSARRIPTSFGETQVLIGGPAEAPPLVVLHGALASSAHLLVELGPLLARFRVYAVDIVGQSVMSADARIPVAGPGALSQPGGQRADRRLPPQPSHHRRVPPVAMRAGGRVLRGRTDRRGGAGFPVTFQDPEVSPGGARHRMASRHRCGVLLTGAACSSPVRRRRA
ncbi:MAG: hypothetical protein M3Y59_01345 [Myxococcota bacterium]|nr:hypothetical protein [Myxococcota bacterium]